MAGTALPPADLLPVGRRANLPYRAVRLVALPLLRLFFSFQVEGQDNIPRFPSPLRGAISRSHPYRASAQGQGEGRKSATTYIVIANHLNWLDEFALLMLFPVEPRLHFLADPTGLVKRRLQWWLIRTTGGYAPVVRARHGAATRDHPVH